MSENTAVRSLQKLLAFEDSLNTSIDETDLAKIRAASRVGIASRVRQTKNEGNIFHIIESELALVERDRALYANSKQMKDSLDAAIEKLTAIQRLMSIVDDPVKYRFLADQGHSLARNRDGNGLPMDEARKGFNSELTRIDNLRKANSDDEAKEILDARYAAMNEARSLYIEKQRKTLGIV